MKKTLAILLTLVMLAVSAVSFAEAAEKATCTYTIYNVTGEKVTELYAIDALTGEKGENYAGEAGIENGAVIELSKTVDADKTGKEFFVIDLTFVTEGGYTGHFGNLHFETVPISLISAEAAAGATQITFFVPTTTCTYTIYNVTGEKVTELYAIDALTGEKGENYAGEAGIENGAVIELSKTVDIDKTGKEFFVIDLTFVTESGYTGHFGNLHFETVPISLLSAEAAAGATQISFFAPAN